MNVSVGKSYSLLLHGRNVTNMLLVPRFIQGKDDQMIRANNICRIDVRTCHIIVH